MFRFKVRMLPVSPSGYAGICKAIGNGESLDFSNTIVEMDEAYLGGKPRKENNHEDDNNKPANKRGRGTKKPAVVGVIDRENQKVMSK